MINVIGTILDSSGYASHTRQLANALNKVTDTRITTNAPQGWERYVTDDELAMLKKQPVKDEINLIITHPIYWKLNTNAKRNFAFLVWEGDRIPKSFIKECLNPDIELIFVPSYHTQDAVLDTYNEMYPNDIMKLWNKIKIIPHGVDLTKFYPKPKPEKCTFFINKGFRNLQDRGGAQYALRAYFEEFTDKDNVELIFKLNPAYGIPDLQRLLSTIAPRKDNLPLLNINTENLPYDKLVDMYNKCNVFVSTTRAEAYNLPCIEALACGLPVITTNFGGQTDYCTNDNGWLVGGSLDEITHELQYEGTKWLTPNIAEIRHAMREAYENKALIEAKSKVALDTAKANTWTKTASKIVSFI